MPSSLSSLKHRAARAVASVRRATPGGGALVIPPTGPGSLGDEAMCEAIATTLRRAGVGPVRLFARPGADPWPDLLGFDERVYPGGRSVRRHLAVLELMRRHEYVFVVGADCVDGHYSLPVSLQLIGALDLAARLGCVTTLVGSSYKPSAHEATADALRAVHPLVRLCARDPLSRDRMVERSGRSVELVADAAFLLEARGLMSDAAQVDAWFDAQAGRSMLGVNFNHQVFRPEETDRVERLLGSYAEAIEKIAASRPLSVLMLPHDYRGSMNDDTNADRLVERLRPALGERVMKLPPRRTPAELKGVASRLDAVLTGRMHLAIASLGKGTPPACVVYQGKFEGLMRHFGLEGLTLEPTAALEASELAGMVERVLDRSAGLRSQITERLPSIRAMSLQNLPESIRVSLSNAEGAVSVAAGA